MAGVSVESDLRAETLADHLEKVQWAVRPVSLREGQTGLISNVLPVELGNITKSEICSAAKQLNIGKSCGTDAVPAEFWKAIILHGSSAMQ
jgi:hypothetical protein